MSTGETSFSANPDQRYTHDGRSQEQQHASEIDPDFIMNCHEMVLSFVFIALVKILAIRIDASGIAVEDVVEAFSHHTEGSTASLSATKLQDPHQRNRIRQFEDSRCDLDSGGNSPVHEEHDGIPRSGKSDRAVGRFERNEAENAPGSNTNATKDKFIGLHRRGQMRDRIYGRCTYEFGRKATAGPVSFLADVKEDGKNTSDDLSSAKGTIGHDHDALALGCVFPGHRCRGRGSRYLGRGL